jgi:hypothetical protein
VGVLTNQDCLKTNMQPGGFAPTMYQEWATPSMAVHTWCGGHKAKKSYQHPCSLSQSNALCLLLLVWNYRTSTKDVYRLDPEWESKLLDLPTPMLQMLQSSVAIATVPRDCRVLKRVSRLVLVDYSFEVLDHSVLFWSEKENTRSDLGIVGSKLAQDLNV